ncbi:hypothetical protein ABW19_dt0206099 [Dactylella cylindrospora]|nr:hypothetical protein ABW19_dt0206099 [Dactylella cylindrospora]
MSTPDSLLQAAESLCNDFASKADLPTLLSHFTTSYTATAFEHGDPRFAPFIGRAFTGIDGIIDYFSYLSELLSYRDMEFSEYFVDAKEQKVSVKGKAAFTWLATEVEWEEVFTYTLDFLEEDGVFKVSRYQVWADTGAL